MSKTNSIATLLPDLVNSAWAFRNKIINGSAAIAQRPSLVASTGVQGYGGPDRYFSGNLNAAGGQFTQSQGTLTYNGTSHNAVVQTVNTAIATTTSNNIWLGIQQSILGANCYDLLGQAVAISFLFAANTAGIYSLALRDGDGANSWVTTFFAPANVTQKIIIPVSVLPANLNTSNNSFAGLLVNVGGINTGSVTTSTLGAWQGGSFYVANTATNWGTSIGNFIAITNLQLEAGPAATTFENRPNELALCQPYCETGTIQFPGVATASAQVLGQTVPFKATKISSPTMTYTTTLNTNCSATLVFSPVSDSFLVTSTSVAAGAMQFNATWLASDEL